MCDKFAKALILCKCLLTVLRYKTKGISSENLTRKCTFSYRIKKPVYLKAIKVK